jgi:hypothetical protein
MDDDTVRCMGGPRHHPHAQMQAKQCNAMPVNNPLQI